LCGLVAFLMCVGSLCVCMCVCACVCVRVRVCVCVHTRVYMHSGDMARQQLWRVQHLFCLDSMTPSSNSNPQPGLGQCLLAAVRLYLLRPAVAAQFLIFIGSTLLTCAWCNLCFLSLTLCLLYSLRMLIVLWQSCSFYLSLSLYVLFDCRCQPFHGKSSPGIHSSGMFPAQGPHKLKYSGFFNF